MKSVLDQKQKEQFSIQERSIEYKHTEKAQSIRSFLLSVSEKRRNLKEPNSFKLVAKIDRAQEYVKVETRVRRTVMALESIAKKPLIYNKDIPTQQIAKEVIVPPGKPFTGSLKLKEILRKSQGYVKIIDPYVDDTTLDFLLSIPEGTPIRLLTAQTGGKEKGRRLRRECNKFKSERPEFGIRKCEPGLIHDRFMLTQNQGWNIGTSIKDIGKKLSMITEVSTETKNEVEKRFGEIWKTAKNLLGK